MEPSSSYRSLSCPHCKKLIPFPNFDLHEAQCLRQMSRNPPTSPAPPSSYPPPLSSCPPFPSSNPPPPSSHPFRPSSSEESYICPDCLMELPICVLGSHDLDCEQRNISCPDCHFSFPFSLMDSHRQECPGKHMEEENPLPPSSSYPPPSSYVPSSFPPSPSSNPPPSSYNPPPSTSNPTPSSFFFSPSAESEDSNVVTLEHIDPTTNAYIRINRSYLPDGTLRESSFSINNGAQFGGRIGGRGGMRRLGGGMGEGVEGGAGGGIEGRGRGERRDMTDFFNFFQNQSRIQDPLQNFHLLFGRNPFGFPRGINMMGGLIDLNQILSQLGESERGLEKEEVDKFPVFEWKEEERKEEGEMKSDEGGKKLDKKGEKKEEEGSKCVICYSDFEKGEKIRSLACWHRFHIECIDKWLEKSSKCPICKEDMKKVLGK